MCLTSFFTAYPRKKISSVKYCNIKMLFELNANSLKMKLLHYTIQEHKEHKMDIDFVFFFFFIFMNLVIFFQYLNLCKSKQSK